MDGIQQLEGLRDSLDGISVLLGSELELLVSELSVLSDFIDVDVEVLNSLGQLGQLLIELVLLGDQDVIDVLSQGGDRGDGVGDLVVQSSGFRLVFIGSEVELNMGILDLNLKISDDVLDSGNEILDWSLSHKVQLGEIHQNRSPLLVLNNLLQLLLLSTRHMAVRGDAVG